MPFRSGLCHAEPRAWKSRCAPLHDGGHVPTWRERAARHREHLGVPVGRSERGQRGASLRTVAAQALHMDTPRALPVAPPRPCTPDAIDEADSCDGDWWGSAMRLDTQRYIAYRNARLCHASHVNGKTAPALDHSAVWATVQEVLACERVMMRHDQRKAKWPDTLRSTSQLGFDEVDELRGKLDQWIGELEAAGGDDGRAMLRSIPIDVLLRQFLSDAYVASGNLHLARRTLLQAVIGEPSESSHHGAEEIQLAPLLFAWDDKLECGYLKAQQCIRFGRCALLAAELGDSSVAESKAPGVQRLRDVERTEMVQRELSSARRQLVEACKLYDAEIASLQAMVADESGLSWGIEEAEEWRLALRCARLGAQALLASVHTRAGNWSEAQTVSDSALHEAMRLQNHPRTTMHLRRLLAAERQMLEGLSEDVLRRH